MALKIDLNKTVEKLLNILIQSKNIWEIITKLIFISNAFWVKQQNTQNLVELNLNWSVYRIN
jgi:hypothetical protein